MTHHRLSTPVTEAQTRALAVGDTVTLEGTLFGIRDATPRRAWSASRDR